MKYPLSSSRVYQVAQNTAFFDASFENIEQLKVIASHDWMPSVVDKRRSNDAFIFSTFIYGDVDNEGENQCSIEEFKKIFADKKFFITTSRNHQKEKVKNNGKISPPTDRYHVLFPLSEVIYDGDQLDELLNQLVKDYPFFDASAKGRCRFFYGNKDVEIIYNPGKDWEIAPQEIIVPEYNPEYEGEKFTEESSMEKILDGLKLAYDTGAFNDYHDWIRCGQALKFCGCSIESFQSITDPVAHKNMEAKWKSFTATHLGKGTLVHYARLGNPDLLKPGSYKRELAKNAMNSRPGEVSFNGSEEKVKLVGCDESGLKKPVLELVDKVENKNKSNNDGTDFSRPAPIEIFKHIKVGKDGKPSLIGTLENFEALLNFYHIGFRENLMTHNLEIMVPNAPTEGKVENSGRGVVISLCALNSLPCKDSMDSYLTTLANKNRYHPVDEWFKSMKSWSGQDYIGELVNLLVLKDGFPKKLARTYIEKWLVSGVAAVKSPAYRGRGVLTLQGPQSIGKTTFFRNLVPEVKTFHDPKMFCEGLSLDPRSKDSVELAISHWISELGELEGVFKRADMAALKAFLTKDADSIRMPYERRSERYPRKSIFCATVNEEKFLNDSTGSTRFWIIPIESFTKELARDVFNLEGIWGQAVYLYEQGTTWWLSGEEESMLSVCNSDHEEVDEILDSIRTHYDLNSLSLNETVVRNLSVTQIATELGYKNAQRSVIIKLNQSLKKISGIKRVKLQGFFYYRMPALLSADEQKAISRAMGMASGDNTVPFNEEDIGEPPF